MHIFFASQIIGGKAALSPEESTHCVRVLRLKKGDDVEIIDGKGGYFSAVIRSDDARECLLEITGRLETFKKQGKVHIAIAPTKHMDRFEWFVEKAVEIGVDEITPLLCQRSERRMLKTDRLEKLIISTMKQAKVAIKPVLNEITPFGNLISQSQEKEQDRFIAHCEDNTTGLLQQLCHKDHSGLVLIGPEGDFSPVEISQAITAGFIPVSLGGNRLRTETAGIVACHILNLFS
jgi:16S rRNA (uracil1498-N3)-methyltransferase